MDKRIIIYGSKDFASTIKYLVKDCGYETVGMIDDFRTGTGILGTFEEISKNYSPKDYSIVIAIGYSNLAKRWEIYQKVKKKGYEIVTLIHPKAYVSSNAIIEQGAMVMAGAIVDVNAIVSELAVLWPGVVLNHDSIVGKNTFVSPNATICGFSKIGSNSFIGAGSVVIEHQHVPDNTFVKANHLYFTNNTNSQ